MPDNRLLFAPECRRRANGRKTNCVQTHALTGRVRSAAKCAPHNPYAGYVFHFHDIVHLQLIEKSRHNRHLCAHSLCVCARAFHLLAMCCSVRHSFVEEYRARKSTRKPDHDTRSRRNCCVSSNSDVVRCDCCLRCTHSVGNGQKCRRQTPRHMRSR